MEDETFEICKVLSAALRRLSESGSAETVAETLDSIPQAQSFPVQVGLLTLCTGTSGNLSR